MVVHNNLKILINEAVKVACVNEITRLVSLLLLVGAVAMASTDAAGCCPCASLSVSSSSLWMSGLLAARTSLCAEKPTLPQETMTSVKCCCCRSLARSRA